MVIVSFNIHVSHAYVITGLITEKYNFSFVFLDISLLWNIFLFANKALFPGHYMYHLFNIQQFYVLPHTVYLRVLCGSEKKKTAIISLYWKVFITETECLLRGTDWVFKFKQIPFRP